MLRNMLAGALFAGLLAGAFAAALHHVMLVPLITEAEEYETGARVHFTSAPDQAPTAAARKAAAEPSLWDRDRNPLHRGLMTLGAEMVTFTGFALVLMAALAMAERLGHAVGRGEAVLWGLAGFLSIHVAPGAVLPPETPGIPAADVGFRQLWWAATVVATGAGIALAAFGRDRAMRAAGIALILLPQLVTPPHAAIYGGVVPPALEGLFVGRSIAAGAMTWAALGALCGFFHHRFRPGPAVDAAAKL